MKRLRLKYIPFTDSPVIKNQKGFALLLSLLIVFLLVVIIFEADFQIRADLRAAGNFRDDIKAHYLSRSGIAAGEALLIIDKKNSSLDDLTELWASPIPDYPLGDGLLGGIIVDEERKININKLVRQTNSGTKINEGRKKQLERLFQFLDLKPELVDPIIDWIDNDDTPLPYGAESSSYQSRDPGYNAKNRPFETLRELRMVQGITQEIFKTIEPHLTVYGNGKINVNTADRLVLKSIDQDIDESEARRLEEKRPFQNSNATDFKKLLPPDVLNRMASGESIADFTIRSSYFKIESTGTINDTRKITTAIVERKSNATKLLYFRVE